MSTRNLSSSVSQGKPIGNSSDRSGFGPPLRICLALLHVPQTGAKCTQHTRFDSNQWYNNSRSEAAVRSKTKIVALAPFLRTLSSAIEFSMPYCLETEHSVAVPEKTSIIKHSLTHRCAQSCRKPQERFGCACKLCACRHFGSAHKCHPRGHLSPSLTPLLQPFEVLYPKHNGSPAEFLCHLLRNSNGMGVLPLDLFLPFPFAGCCCWCPVTGG